MKSNNHMRVLAVGIDAAEPQFIRRLMAENQLPALQALLKQGGLMRVESPSRIGSGSVWPTFVTGEDPGRHGVYGQWSWQPETMAVNHYQCHHLKPFWKTLAEQGTHSGVLDVPFAPLVGLREGFEISEWGAHDCLEGRMQAGPAQIAELVTEHPRHPLSMDRLDAAGADDYDNLKKLADGCQEGIRLRGVLARRLIDEIRPRFSMIVFPEIHHAAHYLWHTVESDHEIYDGHMANARSDDPTVSHLYHEVDRQIGELVEAIDNETSILVFSLHGMRPARGIPAFLTRLLCESGFARLADWSGQSWNDRARTVIASVKRSMPKVVKDIYYKTMPHATTQRLAQPTMLPAYDWSNTRAFSLPSDQHGWIRINLCEREAKGIVPVAQYANVCSELEDLLRSLTTEDGKPLAREIFRSAPVGEDPRGWRLPDLVAHWENAVFASPLRIRGLGGELRAIGTKFSGQHSLEGFCIIRSQNGLPNCDSVLAKDMHKLITGMLYTRGQGS